VTDYPRLIGWSSLDLAHHRSLTSFVAIAGTVCRFQNRRAAVGTRVLRRAPRLTHATETTTPPDPSRGDRSKDQDAFRRVAIDQGYLDDEPRWLSWLESVARPAHRSHLEAAATCVSTCAESSQASVTSPTCLAAHRTSQRAMRWTDFCHLTSSYQYPRIVGSLCVERSRASAVEETACFHDSAIRFSRLHRFAFWLISYSTARALSSRHDACIPYL